LDVIWRLCASHLLPCSRLPIGGSVLWPFPSFDMAATWAISAEMPTQYNGSLTSTLSVSVDMDQLAWAETYHDEDLNGTAASYSTVELCAFTSYDKSVMQGTLYRLLPNGTCVFSAGSPCTVLKYGYIQATFLRQLNLTEANFTLVQPSPPGTVQYVFDQSSDEWSNATVTFVVSTGAGRCCGSLCACVCLYARADTRNQRAWCAAGDVPEVVSVVACVAAGCGHVVSQRYHRADAVV
jgi:hypothetical protein